MPPPWRGRKESGAPSKSHFVVGAAKNLNEKQDRGHAAWMPRDAPSYLVFRCGKLAALPRNPIRCCVCPLPWVAAVAGRPPYHSAATSAALPWLRADGSATRLPAFFHLSLPGRCQRSMHPACTGRAHYTKPSWLVADKFSPCELFLYMDISLFP